MPHLEKYNYPRKSTVLLMVLGMLLPIVPAIILYIAILKPKIDNNAWGARGLGILYLVVGLLFPIFAMIGSKPGELGQIILGCVFIFGPWTLSGVAALFYYSKQRDFLERAGEVVFLAESGMSRVGDLAGKCGLDKVRVQEIVQDAIRLRVLKDFMLDRDKENIVRAGEIKREYVDEKISVNWRCENCGAHCSIETRTGESVSCTFCGTLKTDI